MRIIGIHGKSGSGKTTAAGLLAAELADRGYTVKIDSMILYARQKARRKHGDLPKEELRRHIQKIAASVRRMPTYDDSNPFIRAFVLRNFPGDRLMVTDFVIIHDVRRPEEIEFCREWGTVIYVQGVHRPLAGPAAEHETEAVCAGDLFHGADYIIPKQPSLSSLVDAIREMVRAGGHLKQKGT